MNEELRERLERVIEESEARQVERHCEIERDMKLRREQLDRFESVARQWLEVSVGPCLATLAALFPNAHGPTLGSVEGRVRFGATDEYPATAELSTILVPDLEAGTIEVRFRAQIIPILMEYEREGSMELEAEASSQPRLREFLEDRICRFARDYIRIRDVESPYQADQRVTDPVCGMVLCRWEAASLLHLDRQTYYFCVEDCRGRFESDPDRYLGRG